MKNSLLTITKVCTSVFYVRTVFSLTKSSRSGCHNRSHNTDEANKVVTAPAFMFGDAPLHEIFDGIGNMHMIAGVVRFMLKK